MMIVVGIVAGFGASSFAAGTESPVAVTVVESTSDRIVVEYELGDFTRTPVLIDQREYVKIAIGQESPIKRVGAPELPNICRSVIIPDDAKMVANVVSSRYYEIADILVAPSRGYIPRSVDPADVPFTFGPVYDADAFYPGEVVALRRPYILRKYRGTVIDFNPFQYNPVTRTLRVYTQATVELAKVGIDTVNVLDDQGPAEETSLAFHQIYKRHFINYDEGSRYDPLDEEGDLLIICYDDWLANIQPLVDHKNSIGIDTTAMGVSEVPGGTSATHIKNHIQDVYDSTDLAFVLLVGDAAQVAPPYASGGASDATYAKLAGDDDYPEIMVGRFSAEDAADVDTQVERTTEYEANQATTQDWFWKGMGVASNQGPGDDGEYDYEHVDNIRDLLLAYGYTEVDQIYDPSGTASQVTAGLNEGRGIITYTGHGGPTGWSSTGFSNSHVNALVNDNMLPFITSVACNNGEFDSYTCFGEAWLRATDDSNGEPTGAIAFYGSSISQSWDPPMQMQDEMADLYVAEQYVSFGTLCYAGSCSMMDQYPPGHPEGAGVDMFNTWIYFGDPSLRVVGVAYQPPVEISLPDGAPEYLDPGVETTILVQIEDAREVYVPDSGTLHYRYDDGDFLTSPLTPLGGNLYEATLPQTVCSDTPEFYFSAMGDQGGTIYHPGDEETPEPYTAIVATVTVPLSDDFEADRGWIVENIDLETGSWERGIPAGDGTRGDPVTDFDGSGQCYLTGNAPGNSDVDGGPTRLISPTLDLGGASDAVLSYARWFTCDDDLPPAQDFLEVEVSNDDGVSWTLIESVLSTDEWVERTIQIADYVGLTSQVRVRFSVMDNPNNSKTEAGIDAVEILGLACALPGTGDFDGDGDVDLDDFARFPDCLAGPGATPDPPDPFSTEDCLGAFDFDADVDVDLDDFGPFQRVLGES